ncbi:helix-turn-helix domain-containing protein [Lactobacillus crispatus]|uniref:helix-turn-helix domain-containing protein n=1 Tax=Lactobacillus crispatus TaxID=47770 RepID=UPI0021A36E54|nr:helix-turn-helix transcriptional regulator [Lactobacillus crispatus]
MSKPVSKYSIDSPKTFINTKFVYGLIKQLGTSQQQVSKNLNWSPNLLNHYCSYQRMLSKEKRQELAEYFHCSESKLIDYYPSDEVIKKHSTYSINHNRNRNRQEVSINNNINTKDYSTELLLEKISSLEKTIKLLIENQNKFMDFFKEEFQKSAEQSNKQQLYILNQLKRN